MPRRIQGLFCRRIDIARHWHRQFGMNAQTYPLWSDDCGGGFKGCKSYKDGNCGTDQNTLDTAQFASYLQDEHVDPLQHIHLARLNTDEGRRYLNDEFGLNIELGVVSQTFTAMLS